MAAMGSRDLVKQLLYMLTNALRVGTGWLFDIVHVQFTHFGSYRDRRDMQTWCLFGSGGVEASLECPCDDEFLETLHGAAETSGIA